MELKRNLAQQTLNAITEPFFYNVWMVFIDWPEGPVRAHSGVGTITFQGVPWVGVGNFGTITLPEESLGMASFPAEIEVTGLPSEIMDYLESPVRNRTIKVYAAIVTERAGNQVIGDPFEIWNGYADAMTFNATEDGENLNYGIRIEARGGPTVRASAEVYHTAEDQATKFPADSAGRLTINAEAEGSKLTWPES